MDIEPQLKTIHVGINYPESHVKLLIGERDGQVLLQFVIVYKKDKVKLSLIGKK